MEIAGYCTAGQTAGAGQKHSHACAVCLDCDLRPLEPRFIGIQGGKVGGRIKLSERKAIRRVSIMVLILGMSRAGRGRTEALAALQRNRIKKLTSLSFLVDTERRLHCQEE